MSEVNVVSHKREVELIQNVSLYPLKTGHPADFDYWAQLGNYGWSYEDVLPFFKKSEDNRIKGLDKGYFLNCRQCQID